MRKFTMLVSMAAVAAVGFPAHAAKYNCTISQDTTVVKQCSIDPTTSTTSCAQSLSNNMVGFCLTAKSSDDKTEALLCGFGAQTAVEAVKQNSLVSLRAAAAQPGFSSASLVEFNPAARTELFETVYRENQSSPLFSATCQ